MQAPSQEQQAPASALELPPAEGSAAAPAAKSEPEDKPESRSAQSQVSAAERQIAIEKADALIKHGLEVFNRGQPEQARHMLDK